MSRYYLEPAKLLIRLKMPNAKDRIVNAVCKEYCKKDLLSRVRKEEIIIPYYAAFKLFIDITDISIRELMNWAGRDRTSFYHTRRTVNNLFETDRHFRERVMRILETITKKESELCSTESSTQRPSA